MNIKSIISPLNVCTNVYVRVLSVRDTKRKEGQFIIFPLNLCAPQSTCDNISQRTKAMQDKGTGSVILLVDMTIRQREFERLKSLYCR